jgi:hypothetical protein
MGVTACDHGFMGGFSADVGARIRRFFAPRWSVLPFVYVGASAKIVSFAADDVRGIALPAVLGAGARKEIAPGVHAVAGANMQLGIGHFNRGLGWEPHATFAFHFGAEFNLF